MPSMQTQLLAVAAGALVGRVVYYATDCSPLDWQWWAITLPPCI